MEDKILDCVNYIKNISKQKVTSARIFLYMKKNGESVSEEEIQKTIATLISLNRLEERGIGLNHTLFPLFLTMFWLRKHRLWMRINQIFQKWKIQSLIRQTT